MRPKNGGIFVHYELYMVSKIFISCKLQEFIGLSTTRSFMFYRKPTYFLFLLLTLFNTFNSQTLNLKALQHKITTCGTNNDSNKVGKAHFLIGAYYHNHQTPDSSLFHYKKAIPLSLQQKDHSTLGKIYSNLSVLPITPADSVMVYAKRALSYRFLAKDSLEIGSSYMQIASFYDSDGSFNEALKYNLSSIRIFERKRFFAGLVNSYNNIAVLYYNLGEKNKCIEYYHKTLNALTKHVDSVKLGGVLSNLANIYKEINKRDSAIIYYNRSFRIREAVKDTFGLGELYYNMADLFYLNKQYAKALTYIKQCVYFLERSNPAVANIYGYRLYGSILTETGEFAEAEKFLMRSKQETEKANLLPELNRCYMILSEFYEKKEITKTLIFIEKNMVARLIPYLVRKRSGPPKRWKNDSSQRNAIYK